MKHKKKVSFHINIKKAENNYVIFQQFNIMQDLKEFHQQSVVYQYFFYPTSNSPQLYYFPMPTHQETQNTLSVHNYQSVNPFAQKQKKDSAGSGISKIVLKQQFNVPQIKNDDKKVLKISGSPEFIDSRTEKLKKSQVLKKNAQKDEKQQNWHKKGLWTPQQQEKLKELVLLLGQHWKSIGQHFPDRNSKQIRERYLNYLRPNIEHGKWRKEEDDRLQELVKAYGHRWKFIEQKLKNRSQNQIKNRYYGHIKKVIAQKEVNSRNY